ncbi:AVAST type 1 anti-phage system protein Avs1c [Undibacterium sp. Xuan67W]|uniref:AVAST type 1 anti-phage system protein Avs1c n=1 Tax=Undibacterium sp. Xuan67W TaxID=3413057 RepID=UPI003BF2AF6A
MNIRPIDTPETREEFERRFHLTAERLLTGKLKVMRGVGTGLERVRFLPNGRIDLLSIDESARVTANTMANFTDEFKDIIQKGMLGDDSVE